MDYRPRVAALRLPRADEPIPTAGAVGYRSNAAPRLSESQTEVCATSLCHINEPLNRLIV
jgi:hypothetical protein